MVFFRFAPIRKVEKTRFEQNLYSIPRVFFRFAPMGKVEIARFEQNYTTFVDLRQPGFMRFLEKPTQNGGMKPKL